MAMLKFSICTPFRFSVVVITAAPELSLQANLNIDVQKFSLSALVKTSEVIYFHCV